MLATFSAKRGGAVGCSCVRCCVVVFFSTWAFFAQDLALNGLVGYAKREEFHAFALVFHRDGNKSAFAN